MTANQRAAAILRLYADLPDTSHRPRTADRQLARSLAEQGIDLTLVLSAMLLACARRRARPTNLPPLPPIRALAYFLPIIDELAQQNPLDPAYRSYLQRRLLTEDGRAQPAAEERAR